MENSMRLRQAAKLVRQQANRTVDPDRRRTLDQIWQILDLLASGADIDITPVADLVLP
jgi:hypothetical protein